MAPTTIIKKIELTNIKGIANHTFELDLSPNKPNILVAPNGFGKSSFAVGFNSLKRDKLELEEKNYRDENIANRPSIAVTISNPTGVSVHIADDSQNTIKDELDVFVINSQLIAKATKLNAGKFTAVKPSLEVAPVALVPSIPQKTLFTYSPSKSKKAFGVNGKILPNIQEILSNGLILSEIQDKIQLNKFLQVKVNKAIESIKDEINKQSGKIEQIFQWIETNKLDELRAIEELKKLADILTGFDGIQSETEGFLAAIELIEVFKSMGNSFKRAIYYTTYLADKVFYERLIEDFNTTTHAIKPKEDKKRGSLVVEWPKAHIMSNGQRDVMSFITLLMKAKRMLRKQNCVLIIDEIFDYLDDANLITFQYFITQMIEEMKAEGRNFFPILLTHIDPLFFRHFCFNKHKMKVVYLKDMPQKSGKALLDVIKKREEPAIKDNLDNYFFHYNPKNIDITADFVAANLPKEWGTSEKFKASINKNVVKYLNDQANYDPLAICFAVRIRIEELAYDMLSDPAKKQEMLQTKKTAKKLEYCESAGVDIPEMFYLLGIIYNNELHWREGLEIVRPMAIKLENLVIKHMIKQLY